MEPNFDDLIARALELLTKGHTKNPGSDECNFIIRVMVTISILIRKFGCPSKEVLAIAENIGKLTAEDCQIAKTNFETFGSFAKPFSAKPLLMLVEALQPSDNKTQISVEEIGKTYAFEVCQALPAFINAICEVYHMGLTPDEIKERAADFDLMVFGISE
jgi:hypothetical protein